jgi:hypothetical protein
MLKDKVYYHGSPSEIEGGKFKPTESLRGWSTVKNDVYFFTDDIKLAKKFANGRSLEKKLSHKGYITSVHLYLDNVLDLSNNADDAIKLFDKMFPETKGMGFENELDIYEIWTWLDDPEIVEKIKSYGYDAVKLAEPLSYNSTSIAVFYPEKIKIISTVKNENKHMETNFKLFEENIQNIDNILDRWNKNRKQPLSDEEIKILRNKGERDPDSDYFDNGIFEFLLDKIERNGDEINIYGVLSYDNKFYDGYFQYNKLTHQETWYFDDLEIEESEDYYQLDKLMQEIGDVHNPMVEKITIFKESMNNIQKEILKEIKKVEIKCPDCESMCDDDQYTCTTCWCEGGDGRINVFQWLKDHPESFSEK